MARERLEIVVTETGTAKTTEQIRKLGDAGGKTESVMGKLKTTIAGIGFLALAREVLQTADSYTNLQNQLKNVTDGSAQLRVVTRDLLSIANRTRGSFENTVKTYAKISRQADQLGISQSEVAQFTETLNKTIALSGAASQEAASGVLQLGQALASGKLAGDELKSILENVPEVAVQIAQGMGVTVGALKELGSQGQITAVRVIDAFKRQREEIDQRFAKTVPTLGQAVQVLSNNFTNLVGEIDKNIQGSTTLGGVILTLAENMDIAYRSAVALGTFFAVALAGRAIPAVIGALKALRLALIGTGIGAFVAIVGAATAALVGFGDQITVTSDGMVTLSDVASVVWGYIRLGIEDVKIFFKQVFNAELPGSVGNFVNQAVSFLAKLPEMFINFLDFIVIRFRATFNALYAGVKTFVDNIATAFNTLKEFASNPFDLNVLRREGAFGGKSLGDAMGKAFNDSLIPTTEGPFNALKERAIDFFNVVGEQARQAAQERILAAQEAQRAEDLARAALGQVGAGAPASTAAGKTKKKSSDFGDSDITLFDKPPRTFIEGLKAQLIEMQDATRDTTAIIGSFLGNLIGPGGSISKGISAIGSEWVNMLTHSEYSWKDFGQRVREIASGFLQSIARQLVEIGVNMAINAALGNALATAATAASIAQGVAVLAAWQPAATAASIATLGGAAAAGTAAANTAIATSKGLAAAGAAGGFAAGGYTGNVGRDQVAGVVHGQEFVMNAAATRRIGVGNLEKMNAGSAMGSQLNVTVINRNIPGADFEVRQLGPNEVEIIAKRVVQSTAPSVIANDLASPNSRTSKAITSFTSATRRRA